MFAVIRIVLRFAISSIETLFAIVCATATATVTAAAAAAAAASIAIALQLLLLFFPVVRFSR